MVFKKLCCRYHPVRYDFVDKWNINSMSPWKISLAKNGFSA